MSRVDIGSGDVDVQSPTQGTPTDLTVRSPVRSQDVLLAHGPTEAGVVLFNAGTGGVGDSVNLSEGAFAFGSPRVAARGDTIWVATGDRRLGRLSFVRGRLESAAGLPRDADEADAFVSAMTIDDGAVWAVGDPNQPELWRIDPETGRIVATIPLPHAPTGVAVGLGAVWVTSYLDDVVMRVDRGTNRVTDRISTGRGAAAIAVGEGSVWVANEVDGTMSRIDAATLESETIGVDGSPTALVASGDGIWVTTRPHPRTRSRSAWWLRARGRSARSAS